MIQDSKRYAKRLINMKIFLNNRSPKESLPQTEVSLSPDYGDFKQRIQALEGTISSLQRQNKSKDEMISELQTQIVTLTEENIHLRAKLTNFKDLKELSNGIEQTATLLNKITKPEEKPVVVAKPTNNAAHQVCLFNEIDTLKEQLDKKKKEYDQTLSSFAKPIEHKTKPKITLKRNSTKKKKQLTYVPSFLRKRQTKIP